MEIKVNANAVLASPFNSFEEVSEEPSQYSSGKLSLRHHLRPGGLCQEWLISTSLNGPERKRDPHKIETGSCNLCEVLLRLNANS